MESMGRLTCTSPDMISWTVRPMDKLFNCSLYRVCKAIRLLLCPTYMPELGVW